MYISLVRRELANFYHFRAEPGLFTLACQKKLSTGVADQAARLKLSASYDTKNALTAGLFRQQEQYRIRLEIAADLHGKGLSTLTGKVTLIGSGNYDLKSADGDKVVYGCQETEIVSFRIGAVEYPLAKPLRVTITR